MAMLLITHDLAVVSGMADQVALMYAGQIVEVASAADFLSDRRTLMPSYCFRHCREKTYEVVN